MSPRDILEQQTWELSDEIFRQKCKVKRLTDRLAAYNAILAQLPGESLSERWWSTTTKGDGDNE